MLCIPLAISVNEPRTKKTNGQGEHVGFFYNNSIFYNLCPTSSNSSLYFYILPTKHCGLPSWGYCRALWLACELVKMNLLGSVFPSLIQSYKGQICVQHQKNKNLSMTNLTTFNHSMLQHQHLIDGKLNWAPRISPELFIYMHSEVFFFPGIPAAGCTSTAKTCLLNSYPWLVLMEEIPPEMATSREVIQFCLPAFTHLSSV